MNLKAAAEKMKNHPQIGLVILAYVAFIALGMPDGLLGVAWPSIRAGFGLPLDALGSLLAVSMSGYLISSFLSGKVISRLGVGKVLIISCALTGGALLGYTLVPSWWMMVSLAIFAGLGAGTIDAGLNTYVATHFSEGLMQWLHASYGVGITSGPFIMTLALNSFGGWRPGYLIVAGVQLVLAACFVFTLPLWSGNNRPAADSDAPRLLTDYQTGLRETLRKPRVWLSMLHFFFYTGSEIATGTWAYSLLTEARGISPQAAGAWTGSYWLMFTVGRVIAGLFARRLGVNKLVLGSFGGALLGALLLWWNPAPAANLAAVGIIGLAIAPIFPALVSGTSQRVGERYAANAIGMQITAGGLGGVLLPSLAGVLAQRTSLEVIPLLLAGLFALQIALYWVNTAGRQKRG